MKTNKTVGLKRIEEHNRLCVSKTKKTFTFAKSLFFLFFSKIFTGNIVNLVNSEIIVIKKSICESKEPN